MPSAPTTPRVRGRHRLGLPGMVPVTAFTAVVRHGLFGWWGRGRHRAGARHVQQPLARVSPATAV